MPVERYTDPQGRLFIKAPLINNLPNQRGWRAIEEANKRFAQTAINKAVTLMLDKMESRFYDYHPFMSPKYDPATGMVTEPTAGEHAKFAAKYGFGIVREVGTESGIYKAASGEIPWFFTYEVIDPVAKEELSKDDTDLIPPAYSPGILHYDGPDDAVSEYEIVHVAAVPKGAYGPRFVNISKCQGDAMSCLPQLKAASFKDRTGGCPKDAFSSLLAKGASSNDNMSLPGVEVPAPTQPSNNPNAVRADNSAIKPQGQNDQNLNRQGQQSFKKPTIKINRIRNQSTEPKPEDNGEGEGGGGENEGQQQAQQQPQGNSNLDGRVQELEKQLKERDTRYFVEGIIRKYPHLVSSASGKYNDKKYQQLVEEYTQKIMKGEASPATVSRLLELEAKVPVLEVKRASSPIDDFIAPAIQPKGASSLEDDEATKKQRMLGQMFRHYLGGF